MINKKKLRVMEQRVGLPVRNPVATYFVHHAEAIWISVKQLCGSPFANLMTFAVIGIAIALPLILWLTLSNVQALTKDWDKGVHIALFLKKEVTSFRTEMLVQQLETRPEVEKVQYISPAQALQDFEKQSGINNVLSALTENPLPGLLLIYPVTNLQTPEAIEKFYKSLKQLPEVDLAQLDMEWVKRLYGYIDLGKRVVTILAGLLGIGVLLIIGNTIRLTTLNAHREIEVIQLIGGSSGFIRRPFLYTGILYGLIGGIVGWLSVSSAIQWLRGPIQQLAASYQSDFQLLGLQPMEIGILLAATALLGFVGSWLSVGYHLRD